MPIVPLSSANPSCYPGDGRQRVIVRRNSPGELDVTLRPGADVTDLGDALGHVPTGSIFTEHFGDVTAVLVFRPIASVPAEAASSSQTGRAQGAAATIADPIDTKRPASSDITPADYQNAIRHSLGNVDLGDYDNTVVNWLAGLGTPMIGGVIGLIYRARRDERLSVL